VSARPRTLLIHDLERALLLSAMRAAAVHVLPSWFETAGLTSLEAAAAGCAVVSTDRGYAAAYLEQEAHYCDPGDPGSIRRAVRRALAAGPSERLRQRVLERFTEERSAAEVDRVYRSVDTAPVQVAR
jgi:glycosyltransferase involved in cell wall biosynthesis